jgi:hypothetical protein
MFWNGQHRSLWHPTSPRDGFKSYERDYDNVGVAMIPMKVPYSAANSIMVMVMVMVVMVMVMVVVA